MRFFDRSVMDEGECKMLNIGRGLIVMLCVFCFAATAFPGWKLYKSAKLRNKEQNTLKIDRVEGHKALAWLLLKRKNARAFASGTPLYQVDDGPVHDLASMPAWRTDPEAKRWIRWEIWNGKGTFSPLLLELMNGKRVVFQYYLPDGEIVETAFSLEGAKEAITEAVE